MSEQRNTITRQELYERVWTTPIVRLAGELGYSYPELITIVTVLNIPRPSGGYWYRLQHGGGPEQIPLPPAPEGAQNGIPFGPRLNAPQPPEPPAYVGESDEAAPVIPKKQRKTFSTGSAGELANALKTAAVEPTVSPVESNAQPTKPAAPTRVAPKFADVVEMTREELYQHVWTTPIHLLADALGLSDVGLAKTCVQMEVPRPGRGYWARIDAGEALERIQLPKPSVEAVQRWKFNVVLNRQRRAEWASANLSAAVRGKSLPPIVLPGDHEPLHEIAERHRAAIEKAKTDEQGFVHLDVQNLFRCDVSMTLAPRVVRAVHALVTELEKRGCRFAKGSGESCAHLCVVQGKDRLTVHWREEIVEVEREPTAEDKRKPSWTWQLKEKKPTGQLVVEVSADGLRGARSWTESDSKPLGAVLARVIDKVAATFEGFEAQRQRGAEDERRREEARKQQEIEEAKERELAPIREKERQEKEKRARHEKKLAEIAQVRRSNLHVAAQKWEDSERALAFVDTCEKRWRGESNGELSPAQVQWLKWARSEATKLGPWAEDYPKPDTAITCDPAAPPIGGPYPELQRLKPNDFNRRESEERRPDPYSPYGYSKY